ncbi:cytochrome b5-like [Homalodisca vitripennis]|uniref:cytochrome b5-like n=1 Tax=Homalodisca vitripennis TaxID=197043 RepID=UPI001EEAC221|nr:cytochrome b5-like [Homalodisca vitripennis]
MLSMENTKQYTFSQIQEENMKSNNNLLVVQNSVYNVYSYLREHPGGSHILVKYKNLDATGVFLAVGHSSDAAELMQTFKIGELVESEKM